MSRKEIFKGVGIVLNAVIVLIPPLTLCIDMYTHFLKML